MITVTVQKRGCGYPKKGGFYAIGGGVAKHCYALPVELVPCKCCNQQPKFARCPTPVTSEYLHMLFNSCEQTDRCEFCIKDRFTYWISWIGSDYTANSFNKEIGKLGLSRRIPPSFSTLIKPGDYFVNVKSGKIISLIPVTSVRYYLADGDDSKKIKDIEEKGIEVAKMDLVEEPIVKQATAFD